MAEDDDGYDKSIPPPEAKQEDVTRLLWALWQRQDMDWTISKFPKAAFRQLSFAHERSWKGTKKSMYLRIRPVVCYTSLFTMIL